MTDDKIIALISRPISWMKPLRLSPPNAWVGHIPFAYWLIEAAAPDRLVELGTHSGNSYLAFLQAVEELKIGAQCFAVDTWRGDEHSGFYDDRIYDDLEQFHNARYQSFSRLVRTTFEEALPQFDDGSVDILHLDGLHTYEAVKADFDAWLPKLSERGIVLLHDINVRENHFGVWKLWEELQKVYPGFSFLHSHGLGILLVGEKIPRRVKQLHDLTMAQDGMALRLARSYFGALGSGLLDLYASDQVTPLRLANTAQQEQLAQITERHAGAEHQLGLVTGQLQAHQQRLLHFENTEAELRKQLAGSSLHASGIQMHLTAALEELRTHRQRSPSYEALQAELEKHVAGSAFRELEAKRRLAASWTEIEHLRERSGHFEGDVSKAREQRAAALREVEEIRKHLDAALAELADLRAKGARNEDHYSELVRERADIRLHLDAALAELEVYRHRNSGSEALRALAEGWRDEALDAYHDKIGQLHTRVLESRHDRGISPEFRGRVQRAYSAGHHQLARWLLIFRHPLSRGTRQTRFGAIRKKHQDTVALIRLLGGAVDGAPVSAIFDSGFYVRTNPDVKASGQPPHVHYAKHGAEEDRQPHSLFDPNYYRTSAAAVGQAVGSDGLLHYIECGGRLRIDPHPYFHSGFYLDQVGGNTDRIDHPLFHYLTVGERLGLRPNPDFDPAWYLSANPDIAAAGFSPLQHYLEIGHREGRATSEERSGSGIHSRPTHQSRVQPGPKVFRPREFKPTGNIETVVPGRKADVIIPVYGGVSETKRCVARVIESASQNRTLNKIIIIDDRGPDPAMAAFLDGLANNPNIHLVRNEKNRGFVESVNRGMRFSDLNDAVLLNSDTEVVGNWLDRLAVQAYAARDIGSVTPFSNNATICSYPSLPGRPDLPKGQTVESLDSAFRMANAGRSVDLPTAVGFCMYIKRACLDEVGLFDVETFGKGYGEENDFCLRSIKRGWRHVLAGDVFVYHVGEVSFSENSKKAKEHAWQLLTGRYPEYAASVARFVERDPVIPLRAAATAVLCRSSGLPVVLHLTHRLGGGTAKYVHSLASLGNDRIRSLVLELSASPESFSGRLSDISTELDLEFEAESIDEIADMLKGFGVSRIHIHSVHAVTGHIEGLLDRLSLPYDLTVHDYALICPRINLMSPDGKYCGEPAETGCLACLSAHPASAHPDIIWWRLQGASLIRGAERVICPSQDVADRIARYVPCDNLMVVPHEIIPSPRGLRVPRLRPDEPFRVAVLGVMAKHKGGALLTECANHCKSAGLQVEIIVIGDFDDQILGRAAREAGIRSTGYYDDSDLQQLIDHEDPHLVLYPQLWPETFSFTLSAGLVSGRPLLAPRTGAFTERLSGEDWTWLYELGAAPAEVVEKFKEVRLRILNESPADIAVDNSKPLPLNSFYLSAYE